MLPFMLLNPSTNTSLSPSCYRWFLTYAGFISARNCWCTLSVQLNNSGSCLYNQWKQNGMAESQTWVKCIMVHLYSHRCWQMAASGDGILPENSHRDYIVYFCVKSSVGHSVSVAMCRGTLHQGLIAYCHFTATRWEIRAIHIS